MRLAQSYGQADGGCGGSSSDSLGRAVLTGWPFRMAAFISWPSLQG